MNTDHVNTEHQFPIDLYAFNPAHFDSLLDASKSGGIYYIGRAENINQYHKITTASVLTADMMFNGQELKIVSVRTSCVEV